MAVVMAYTDVYHIWAGHILGGRKTETHTVYTDLRICKHFLGI